MKFSQVIFLKYLKQQKISIGTYHQLKLRSDLDRNIAVKAYSHFIERNAQCGKIQCPLELKKVLRPDASLFLLLEFNAI